ncbi:hypothetical protein PLEOSDRAFT_160889 [Pleurotus ostreatus PC15]|uniref:Uncharacterized protein n=1 Tax=Pleurotus ostreatus (strain PC15) TaxID=1137138 RepID=A0A067NDN8_PLEO1|nr:hypothetical protein PLEOSDRAFT_160889 [Pleurotus ostreatus PC15]
MSPFPALLTYSPFLGNGFQVSAPAPFIDIEPTGCHDGGSDTPLYLLQTRSIEDDKLLVAGTDHGKLYIFEVGSGECLYSLEPKDPCSEILFQIVTSVVNGGRTLIAAGDGRQSGKIVIWEKVNKPTAATPVSADVITIPASLPTDGVIGALILAGIAYSLVHLGLLQLAADLFHSTISRAISTTVNTPLAAEFSPNGNGQARRHLAREEISSPDRFASIPRQYTHRSRARTQAHNAQQPERNLYTNNARPNDHHAQARNSHQGHLDEDDLNPLHTTDYSGDNHDWEETAFGDVTDTNVPQADTPTLDNLD